MDFKSEYYNENFIEEFVFSYGFKNEKLDQKETLNPNLNFQKYENNNLPISMNPMDYVKLINKIILKDSVVYFLQNENELAITIRKFEGYNQIEFFKQGTSLVKFTDEIISVNKFVRILDNKKFYYEDDKEILFYKEMKNKFIKKISPIKNLNNKFILNDFKNSEELIITALKSIMIRKYNGYNIYMHNMAKFDIIFLLKYLVELGIVDPIIHNERIINIKFNFGKKGEYEIYFRDSYLLLTASLKKLSQSFNVEDSKSIFPHLFVNENNLDYIGRVPDFKYFMDISKNDYNEYKASFNSN